MEDTLQHPLAPVVKQWCEKIKKAAEYKKSQFQDDADEALRFFNGPHDFMYGPEYSTHSKGFQAAEGQEVPDPLFRMTINRVAEMVQLFGPVLYHKNPYRQVNPRKVPGPPMEMLGDPMNPMVQAAFMALTQQVAQQRGQDKARASVLEFYLNYTPNELGLKDESRRAIDEAIIKGMGCLWTESFTPPGSQTQIIGSFWDSTDNLFIDPDMHSIKEAKWIARKCVHPVWQVEQDYGLAPGSLKGTLESYGTQADNNASPDGDYAHKQGVTNDLICYYKIFTKMGVGGRLTGSPGQKAYLDRLGPILEAFGDYCYLVVAEDVPYFLNIPPELLDAPGAEQEIMARLEWPVPYWADDEWPMTPIIFHEIPGCVWPMSHLKPGMGELKFLNWAYSYLAGKIRTTSRDFIAVLKEAGEDLKSKILNGHDLTCLELEGTTHKTIQEVVQFLQHPQFNGDIWKVIQAIEMNWEKRVGLTELAYGMSSRQMRSAEEASAKMGQLQVRPDDMANKVEDAMSKVARKEAIAARWLLQPQDVQPIMGEMGAMLWAQLVAQSDIQSIVHELEYRIEAGSTRKPNKDRDAANMGQAMQTLFAPMMQYSMTTGDFTAINALIVDWAKSVDLDPERYLFKPPPPPPIMPTQPGGQPQPGGTQPQQPPGPGQPRPAQARAA